MTTPNLATVAIRPLRRPIAPMRGTVTSAPTLRIPIYFLIELVIAAALAYLAYTAFTEQWFFTGVESLTDWYIDTIAPHFELGLSFRTPPEMGSTGPEMVGRATGVFT